MSTTDANLIVAPLGPLIRYGLTRAQRDGVALSLTSGYRTRDQQIAARRRNCGQSEFDIFQKRARDCSPPTAVPGTSNHERGRAADMSGNKEWLARLLAPYEVTRPVAGEDWHYEWRGVNATATLRKLGADLDRLDYTPAELAFIAGTRPAGSIGTGQQGNATELGPDAATWTQVSIPGLPTVWLPASPGDIIDSGQLGVELGADALGQLAGRLLDLGLWRRIGLGAAGVALILVGVTIIGRDLATSALIPKATP